MLVFHCNEFLPWLKQVIESWYKNKYAVLERKKNNMGASIYGHMQTESFVLIYYYRLDRSHPFLTHMITCLESPTFRLYSIKITDFRVRR